MHRITFSEPLGQVTFMLPDALSKVGGDAQVQGTVPRAGKEVDAGAPLWVPASAGTTVFPALGSSLHPIGVEAEWVDA